MALVTFDDHTCKVISPSVVLDHGLEGENLAWVRDHLRRCEACRERVDRERLRREAQTETAATSAAPRRLTGGLTLPRQRGREVSGWTRENAARLVGSLRVRAYARKPLAQSRRYAVVALMAVLVGGIFVSSSPRFAADAEKQIPTLSVGLGAGSVDAAKPSAMPSPSGPPEPGALPDTSQDRSIPTVVTPATQPTPAATPAPAPAPPAPVQPTVHLTVTPLSGLAPLTITASAAGSTSPSGIARYEFDFGKGPVSPLLGGTSLSNTYRCAGRYMVKVTVTDTTGLSSSAFVYVDVTLPVNPVSC